MVNSIVVLLLLVAGILTAWAAKRGAPFVPTPQKAVAEALKLAEVKKGDVLIDVGSGDGRVLIEGARLGAKVIGYELSPFLWLFSLINLFIHQVSGKVILRDGFTAKFSEANALFLFLMPKTLPNFIAHLEATVKPGTRIITYVFPIVGIREEKSIKPEKCGNIYLYRVPDAGFTALKNGERISNN